MKVAICTCFISTGGNSAENNYVDVTDALKSHYCRRHNDVDFLCSKENPHPGRDPHFCKFSMLLYAFLKGYDWAVWMDADAAPVNMDFDIAEYLSKQDGEHMLIQSDVLGLNSGVFAMPNTERSILWLRTLDTEKVDEVFRKSRFWDQDAIVSLLEDERFKDFAEAPYEGIGFNNYENVAPVTQEDSPIPNEYRKGHWVLHIPAMPDAYRYRRFLRELQKAKGKDCLCPVCKAEAKPYFRKGDARSVEFSICPRCGHIFSPEMGRMSKEQLAAEIYNDRYAEVCKGFGEQTDAEMHDMLARPIFQRQERVLDYGAGRGGFAAKLSAHGLLVDSFDPFFGVRKTPPIFRRYSLVTCINTFNNIYDLNSAFEDFKRLLVPGGTLIAITPTYEDHPDAFGVTPDKWPFLIPERGDVCVCSHNSLRRLALTHSLDYKEEHSNHIMHVFERTDND